MPLSVLDGLGLTRCPLGPVCPVTQGWRLCPDLSTLQMPLGVSPWPLSGLPVTWLLFQSFLGSAVLSHPRWVLLSPPSLAFRAYPPPGSWPLLQATCPSVHPSCCLTGPLPSSGRAAGLCLGKRKDRASPGQEPMRPDAAPDGQVGTPVAWPPSCGAGSRTGYFWNVRPVRLGVRGGRGQILSGPLTGLASDPVLCLATSLPPSSRQALAPPPEAPAQAPPALCPGLPRFSGLRLTGLPNWGLLGGS